MKIKNKPIKKGPQTYQLWVTDGYLTFEARWSNRTDEDTSWLKEGEQMDLVYGVNSRMKDGIESLTLEVKDIKKLP